MFQHDVGRNVLSRRRYREDSTHWWGPAAMNRMWKCVSRILAILRVVRSFDNSVETSVRRPTLAHTRIGGFWLLIGTERVWGGVRSGWFALVFQTGHGFPRVSTFLPKNLIEDVAWAANPFLSKSWMRGLLKNIYNRSRNAIFWKGPRNKLKIIESRTRSPELKKVPANADILETPILDFNVHEWKKNRRKNSSILWKVISPILENGMRSLNEIIVLLIKSNYWTLKVEIWNHKTQYSW